MAAQHFFARFSTTVAGAAGRPLTFVLACAGILLWGVTGPIFHFSETWQLVVNTGTTIITFLMVFVLQNSQNRDGAAIQAKLDDLILVGSGTNQLIGAENLSEDELQHIRDVVDKAGLRTQQRKAKGTKSSKPRAVRKSLPKK